MTLAEADAKYPRIWRVSFYNGLGYHDHEELFLTEEEARAFYDDLKVTDKHIGQTHDIWGWSEKQRAKKIG